MTGLISNAKRYAVAFAVLLLVSCAPALAQHDMHDMSKMPAATKPKSKPKRAPRPKPAATKRRQTAEPKTKPDETDESGDPDEAGAAEPIAPTAQPTEPAAQPAEPAAQPSPASSAVPPPGPADVHKHMPMPAAPSSVSSPAPQPSLQPGAGQPMPAAPHVHGAGAPAPAGSAVQPPPAKSGDMSMEGMTHPSSGTGRLSADDPRALMIMSGEMMDIRVGSKENNSIAMGQMGSGTSWQPATTPMFMWTKVTDRWLVFVHGDAKIGVNSQGGPRGVTKFESQNWIMPMAFRRVGPGTLQLRGMFSLEPFTFSPGGSPQLFQTGETYRGRPLVDRQHPHDLFMELSATYTMPLGERATWFVYGGFPGEPALGPAAFMHRWSASENPSAPLAHHLQDSTHISFGVASTGLTYRWFKLEGSLFNGREPGENRYNFEFNPWTSRSVRLSFAPTENLSMQWSYGLLKNPEALKPGDVRRMTASLGYNKRFRRGNWATSLVWGRNEEGHDGVTQRLNGYLAESTVSFLDKNYAYTRLELVDKTDLLDHNELHSLNITDHHPVFRVGAYTFGAARDVWNTKDFSVAVGGDLTFYSKPAVLDPVYGDAPVSYQLFLRIRPRKMSMSGN